jgi:hypothetical protein
MRVSVKIDGNVVEIGAEYLSYIGTQTYRHTYLLGARESNLQVQDNKPNDVNVVLNSQFQMATMLALLRV